MKQQTKWKSLFWLGIIFTTGPLWGAIGTVAGMIRAFGNLGQAGEAGAGELAEDISFALYTTYLGWIMCLIGVALVVLSHSNLKKQQVTPPSLPDLG